MITEAGYDYLLEQIRGVHALKRTWYAGENVPVISGLMFLSESDFHVRLHAYGFPGAVDVYVLDPLEGWKVMPDVEDRVQAFLDWCADGRHKHGEPFRYQEKNALQVMLDTITMDDCPACYGSGKVDPNAVLGGRNAGGGMCPVCKGKGKV